MGAGLRFEMSDPIYEMEIDWFTWFFIGVPVGLVLLYVFYTG